MWVVRTLLERGYAVRGTVRSASKAKFIDAYFSALGYADKFESVIVEDIMKEGAFDEAVKGVDAIAHTASPFTGNVQTHDDLIKPAVKGTVGMLESALKHGTQVKRIVITSSTAAVVTPSETPTVFTEVDWNDKDPQSVKELGDKAPILPTGYRASKSLAERAAWSFVQEHKAEIGWDISVINPPFVFGPAIHDFTTVASLNTSAQMWISTVTSSTPLPKEHLLYSEAWVDVRDVALAHVLVLEKPDAGGERIIVSAGSWNWQEWIDIANLLENPLKTLPIYKGEPGLFEAGKTEYLISFDTAKEQRILGIKHHTKLETARDTLEDFAKRGW
ncbi:hypothetical protein HYPSUDRAFT_41417 [Hypholoma sublateritium FD-334 SS-4]|uniref:NAD-dependent epimerase/dehydratase domain-containing protein n=1 Tax=Hypholoma sublateritium (strain FD-334 SS-4) TaxID=945553 RepID=A0A0D2PQ44_HYPSF|nr:hypothetical protein HYPSUDRAFT_41417 [Hypholoma sublateritium FD-334 SS-4]